MLDGRRLLLASVVLLIPLICILTITTAQATTVWEILRHEFTLNHETNRSEVQEQIRWLVAHPNYLQTACRQSEPYIYHVINEIKKRNLPGELALLPMIESAYNPFAYSDAGAAGLWQLMPGTGRDLGLKQDWWTDARRSIQPSTAAALNFLMSLNHLFNNDWIFTIAAYDSGPGAVSRAIKLLTDAHQTVFFWNLPVPTETKIYVPRFLALAEVIKNPEQYHLDLPKIPYQPYFSEVNVGSQIDLNHAAKLAGISYKDLIKLNPGFNRWATAPSTPFQLLIPSVAVGRFYQNLAHLPIEKRVSWIKHQVINGDSLANIAYRYHTTVNLIKQLNQLKSNAIHLGQLLLLPSTNNAPLSQQVQSASPLKPLPIKTDTLRLIHIVQPNDSYEKIEKIYGIKTNDIQNWNNLPPNQALSQGQQLIIWRKITH